MRGRRPELSGQLFPETIFNEGCLHVALHSRFICKRQVCVPGEHGLVLQLVGSRIESVQTMSPAADKNQLASPRCQCLDQLCKCFQVVHLISVADEREKDFSIDQLGLLFTARGVVCDIQPHLYDI